MWHLIVDAFKNLEKRETSDAEKTHAAMKRIKNILIAYYDTPHKGMEISNAIRAIPKTLRKNKNIQRVLGTLVRNSSQLVSYYEQTKDTQQTFP